jgi:hypothetical protein
MNARFYYFAANRYEGCGHRHKTVKAARKCLPRIERRGPVAIHRRAK